MLQRRIEALDITGLDYLSKCSLCATGDQGRDPARHGDTNRPAEPLTHRSGRARQAEAAGDDTDRPWPPQVAAIGVSIGKEEGASTSEVQSATAGSVAGVLVGLLIGYGWRHADDAGADLAV